MEFLEKHPGPFYVGDAVTPKVMNDTIFTAIEAHRKAKMVYANMEMAKEKADVAFEKVIHLEERVNNVEFPGTIVSAQGTFGFHVQNGNLILSYCGTVAPAFSIENGELKVEF